MDLLSYQTFVEAPFIILTIGEYTFGAYKRTQAPDSTGITYSVTYPNYMESLSIVKINGAVNTYTINMVYPIAKGSDPNLMDKVFSSISSSRIIYISYGDWSSPSFIYKDEEAILTSVKQNVDFRNSLIRYTLTATSDALSLKSNNYDFPMVTEKPSNVIFKCLQNKQYGLHDVFRGMQNISKVRSAGLIATDDMPVQIEAKTQINILDYLNYLTNCMTPLGLPSSSQNKVSGSMYYNNQQQLVQIQQYAQGSNNNTENTVARYKLSIIDDIRNEFNGPYFTVKKMLRQKVSSDSPDIYDIDVGFPGDNFVTDFRLNSDDTWSILYEFSERLEQQQYIYRINNEGEIEQISSPNLLSQNPLKKQTAAYENWWKQMTEFPIQASITIKGLLRPTILMSYLRVHVYFYGQQHSSSGLYIITKQTDNVSSSGYSTTLELTRVGGL